MPENITLHSHLAVYVYSTVTRNYRIGFIIPVGTPNLTCGKLTYPQQFKANLVSLKMVFNLYRLIRKL